MDKEKRPARKYHKGEREHDVPVIKRLKPTADQIARMDESSMIKSPRLTHDDICRLADNILSPSER